MIIIIIIKKATRSRYDSTHSYDTYLNDRSDSLERRKLIEWWKKFEDPDIKPYSVSLARLNRTI